ncbi:MAG: TIGR03808 family TAT-translocated repetitive protein [Pseudomonadota bacterium]
MDRRRFLTLFGTAGAAMALPCPVLARSDFEVLPLRGSVSAVEYGVVPNAPRDQSAAFQSIMDRAASSGEPLFLPAGNYVISDVQVPDGLTMSGVPNRTALVLGAGSAVLRIEGKQTAQISNLLFDGGAARRTDALLIGRDVEQLQISGCTFRRSSADLIRLERVGGRIAGSRLKDGRRFALFSVDGRGLDVTDNRVEACADGGIIVHRSSIGRDGTRISGNRISRIGAASGGTGQWGNGINIYRSDDVIVSNNMIDNCAFSSIRANTARNIHITGNRCMASGETAIYAEFSFENAIISDNLIVGGANGISVTNFNEGGRGATVSGNIIRDLSGTGPYPAMDPGFGIGIAVEADTSVTGNLIDGAPLYGINAGWGPNLRDVVLQGNVIRNANIGIGISRASGVGDILVADNLIKARNGAIRSHRWTDVDGTDLARQPRNAPSHVTLSGNKTA